MNPKNRSAEETLLHSTPILKKILEHAEPWGNNPQNLTKAHPNFMEIEKAKKFEENISSYSERHIQMFYCTPPCKNAYKYAVSFVLQFFAPLKFVLRNPLLQRRFGAATTAEPVNTTRQTCTQVLGATEKIQSKRKNGTAAQIAGRHSLLCIPNIKTNIIFTVKLHIHHNLAFLPQTLPANKYNKLYK